jgi:hypothetical protein
MGTTRDLTIFMLLVFGIIFLLTLTFQNCGIPETGNTLTGKVEWTETDGENRIIRVAIATQTGEYLVGDNAKGRELLQFVYERVKVKGKITKDKHGLKTIYVSDYKMVPQ